MQGGLGRKREITPLARHNLTLLSGRYQVYVLSRIYAYFGFRYSVAREQLGGAYIQDIARRTHGV